VRQVDLPEANIWEVAWCGDRRLAAVVSPGPAESLWYTATLQIVDIGIDIGGGRAHEIYRPRDQLGWVAASPSGAHVVTVDTVCSDRGVVAGPLILVETETGAATPVDTGGVDVSWTEWRSDTILLFAGHRGLETVAGTYDVATGRCTDRWVSRDITSSGRHVSLSGLGDQGDFVIEGEGFTRAPELAIVRGGAYRSIRSFAIPDPAVFDAVGSVEPACWQAPDGLAIEGWLLKPKGDGPFPLLLNIHGGPVLQARPAWLGRQGAPWLLLLRRGYAILMPNPRGSSGWGAEFARAVFGDIGGLESADNLSGVDHLVAQGIADPKRLAVMGGSHGGFMTSWLVTQDPRFAAAVSIAPITNWLSEHLTSNMAQYCVLAVGDTFGGPAYLDRSPILHAHKVRTPTLNICGALDRCTPPTEALQFHNALLENGVESVLVTYPGEGHGIRSFPAMSDYAARVVAWIADHV
jgi:dipeptidyl aminopeptidase/acylaminoacyl peptidase